MINRFFLKQLVGIVWTVVICIPAVFVHAQSTAQVMSVTPPLFQISAVPGNVWQSSIKVVNGNTYPMNVYAELVTFDAYGEKGQGRFVPLLDTDNALSLAAWITVEEGPYTILPEQTMDIPFTVEFPIDAPPGGHYAAILITTRGGESDVGELSVKTAQAVTSLIFARVEGDIREVGSIREFRTLRSFVQEPRADFKLRFENKGNVHLQPRGDIVITNMWGTERGRVPINYQSHFGNVLPESIREFTFVWESNLSVTDVGRYKAQVTLGYGENGVKSVTQVTYFWVVPLKITLITLTVLALIIGAIVGMVRMYVRHMLLLAGVVPEASKVRGVTNERAHLYRRATLPIQKGVLDLRTKLSEVDDSSRMFPTVYTFIREYKVFFASVVVIIVICIVAFFYIGKATNSDTDYRVIIDEGDAETMLSKEEVENVLGDRE